MGIYCNGVTDVGGRSGVNQDSFGMFTDGTRGIFVVADGMGGHTYGEVASGHIVRAVGDFWKNWSESGFTESFLQIVEKFQDALQNASAFVNMNYNQESICGSTVVAVLIDQGQYATFSVGDSRIYRMDEDSFTQLTEDDIWDNLPNSRSDFTEEQRLAHPNHGKLTQAMGATPNVMIHMSTYSLDGPKVFLLASDGLYQYCKVEAIADCMRESVTVSRQVGAMQTLLEEVYLNGAGDNVTCVVVLT